MEWSGIEDQDTVISLNAWTPQTNQSRKPFSDRRPWHIRLVPGGMGEWKREEESGPTNHDRRGIPTIEEKRSDSRSNKRKWEVRSSSSIARGAWRHQNRTPLWLSVSEARRSSIDSFSPDLIIRNAIDWEARIFPNRPGEGKKMVFFSHKWDTHTTASD